MKKYYIAYGTNINFKEMAARAPTAEAVGAGILDDYELVFRFFLTVEPAIGRVPVFVWLIDPEAEEALDIYEGYGRLYDKVMLPVTLLSGEEIRGMAYIMKTRYPICPPDPAYYLHLKRGYHDFGQDEAPLRHALAMAMALAPAPDTKKEE